MMQWRADNRFGCFTRMVISVNVKTVTSLQRLQR